MPSYGILVLILLLFCGCAKIQSPPGGPADKTLPEVVGTVPEPGAVNVDRLAPVQIEFSEPVVEEKNAKAIYVSPRPAIDPEIDWHKNMVLINWRDSLAADMTYLVTVATRVADRRGNRLAEPLVLAFSTGSAIDSGLVTGVVFEGEKPAANTQVFLFALPLDSADGIFGPPDYVTESGPDGEYTFPYLPDGSYRAIAVADKSKNRILDYGENAGAGTFDFDVSAVNYQPPPLYLYLQAVDTSRFELTRCRVSDNRLLQAEFSHAVDSLSLSAAWWSLTSGTPGETPEIEFIEVDFKDERQVKFLLGGVNVGVSYRLSVEDLADQSGQKVDTTAHTCEFFWPVAPDTVLPEIRVSSPGHHETGVDYRRDVAVWFSEPVDTTQIGASFFLADSSGQTIPGMIEWPSPWKMTYTPATDLTGGMKYTMALDSGAVIDRGGNVADGRWAASFTTLEAGDFGGIAGSLRVARDDWLEKPIIIDFISTEEKHSPISKTTTGPTAFEWELPAGEYTIRAFVDLNDNRHFDRGAVLPYVPAEPRFFFPDTIEVRARFVTEAIDLAIE